LTTAGDIYFEISIENCKKWILERCSTCLAIYLEQKYHRWFSSTSFFKIFPIGLCHTNWKSMSLNCLRILSPGFGKVVNKCTSFGRIKVCITVIRPIGVSCLLS
jgi:hypothetical protein